MAETSNQGTSEKSGLLIQGEATHVSDPPPSAPGFFGRLSKAVQYLVSGAEGWMGPGQPLPPTHQELPTRRFDYPVAANTVIAPSSQKRGVGGEASYAQLRALADNYDLMRGIIESRKNEVSAMAWQVTDPDREPNEDLTDDEKRATAFLSHPAPHDTWETWIRKVVEDLLVVDAVAVYPVATGDILEELRLVDSGTLKKLFDLSGEVPEPPDPAYQQIIKGVPIKTFTSEQIWMRHLNPRTNKMYGFSPVEQIIMTVNIAMRRQLHQLEYYTQGNVPDTLASVPETWSAEDVRQFQNWFDALMDGSGNRRKMKFLPVDASKVKVLDKKDLVDKMDEWLARVVCFIFGTEPTALVSNMNRATAESQHDTSREKGVAPLLTFIEGFINDLLHAHGFPTLSFSFDRTPEMDPVAQSSIFINYVKAGVLSIDEVRIKLGYPELGVPPMVYTNQGPVPVTVFAEAKLPATLSGKPASTSQSEEGGQGEPPTPGVGQKVVQLRPRHQERVSKFYKRLDLRLYEPKPFDEVVKQQLNVD